MASEVFQLSPSTTTDLVSTLRHGNACFSRSLLPSAEALALASRWCRRSCCSTPAASPSVGLPSEGPAFASRCLRPDRGQDSRRIGPLRNEMILRSNRADLFADMRPMFDTAAVGDRDARAKTTAGEVVGVVAPVHRVRDIEQTGIILQQAVDGAVARAQQESL